MPVIEVRIPVSSIGQSTSDEKWNIDSDWIYQIDAGMLWPNGQDIGLEIVWSPVRTLPPCDKGGALVV